MVKVSIELEGSPDDVITTLRRSIGGLPDAVPSEAVTSYRRRRQNGPRRCRALGNSPLRRRSLRSSAGRRPWPPISWPASTPRPGQCWEQAWRAGNTGLHRSALCRRTGLTPPELRTLLMRLGHSLRRFQRERDAALSRPVAANSPLQSYFIDPDFAAAATGDMFSGDE